MKNVKKSLTAIALTGVILSVGFVPASVAAPVSKPTSNVTVEKASIVAKTPTKKSSSVKKVYVTNMLKGQEQVKIASKTFTTPNDGYGSITVPVGTEMSAEYLTPYSTRVIIGDKVHKVWMDISSVKNLMVQVPKGRARVNKPVKAYSKSINGEVVGDLTKVNTLTVYGFSANGKTMVDLHGKRAWVETSALNAGSYTVRIATRDAVVYTYSGGSMHRSTNYIEKRIKKGTKFTVLDSEYYEVDKSSVSTNLYFGSEGGVRAVDSKKYSTKKVKLTNSITRVM